LLQGEPNVTDTRQWLLNGHPRGRPIADDDLKLVSATLPDPAPGQMLLKTHYLGFDPAQKGWMENIADYVAPMAIGDVMRGGTLGMVEQSNTPAFEVGDLVMPGVGGWQDYCIGTASGPFSARKLTRLPGIPMTS
jgi:NADPH-dependent curcumin reductase CurA